MVDVISNSRKKARMEKEAVVHIPDDVTLEILKRLPVRSLLRFGCACKTWYSVISDPQFCNKLHHKRSSVLICKRYHTFAIVESLLKNEKTPIRSIPLPDPQELEPGQFSSPKLLGSCNGLFCVSSVNYRSPETGVYFWNPSTRKLKKLPSPTRVRNWCCYDGSHIFNACATLYSMGRRKGCDENTRYGFCYDESVADYKFVWMVFRDRIIEFDVFSLKSNTWSSFDRSASWEITIPCLSMFDQNRAGVLSNGAVHWVVHQTGHSSSRYRILALELASNNYTLLETPLRSADFALSLSGCLRLCIHYIDVGGDCVHLWMIKEYGVDSSWLKLVSFPTKQFSLCSSGFRTFYPILFSNQEGNIVAVVEHLSWKCREVRVIMRFHVEKGAIVSSETLFSFSRGDGICLLEESLVSLN